MGTEKEVVLEHIGNLNIAKQGKYRNKINTAKVIITNERIKHIKLRHPGDYEKYINYIPDIIKNPDHILEDKKNLDTLLFLKTLRDINKNIQVVIKLQININEKEKINSIITFWHIRARNYKSTIQNNSIIYKNLDNDE